MFYTLTINAVEGPELSIKERVTVKFNRDTSHAKIHFVALDHRMASNIFFRKTGVQHKDSYQIELACYDQRKDIVYMNTKQIRYKQPA